MERLGLEVLLRMARLWWHDIRKLEGTLSPELLDEPTAVGYVDSAFARYDY